MVLDYLSLSLSLSLDPMTTNIVRESIKKTLEHRYVAIQFGGTSFDRDVIEEGAVLKQE